MKKYVIGDRRSSFLNDISTSMLLEGFPFDVKTAKSIDEAAGYAGSNPNSIVVLCDTLLDDYGPSLFSGRSVYGYASTPNGASAWQTAGIQCIGAFKSSNDLLKALSSEQLKAAPMQGNPIRQTAPQKQTSGSRRQQEASPPTTQYASQEADVPSPTPGTQQPVQPAPAQANAMAFSPEMMAMMQQMFFMAQGMQAAQPVTPVNPYMGMPPQNGPIPQPPPIQAGSAMRSRVEEKRMSDAEREVDDDLVARMAGREFKTKTVSVYAAKGGVGKTSIATELAVCLALTNNGRRNFRVCLVDYNIDFGDVASLLELQENGPNMTYWATEIQEMLDNGQDADTISFTKEQMEQYYLQKMKETGLYVLAAPMMHEDSMLIQTPALQIMLRSIIQNGGYDFVICDTGNNTRDSSVTAIEMSDYILLIATQDVTTANCNSSVLRVLRDAGFDTDKVRLVINNVMSSRETGISVQEVEETFPYPCVCRIKRTPDIIRANNIGRPLVYKPKHEYTKQIQKIVRFVAANQIEALEQEKPKRGLFRRST